MKVQLKQFILEEAERRGITVASCYVRWWRGRYNFKTTKKNKRVIFVEV